MTVVDGVGVVGGVKGATLEDMGLPGGVMVVGCLGGVTPFGSDPGNL